MNITWHNKSVLVTGGASFISSHLIDALVELGVRVRAVDNLSSGTLANISTHYRKGTIELIEGDVLGQHVIRDGLPNWREHGTTT